MVFYKSAAGGISAFSSLWLALAAGEILRYLANTAVKCHVHARGSGKRGKTIPNFYTTKCRLNKNTKFNKTAKQFRKMTWDNLHWGRGKLFLSLLLVILFSPFVSALLTIIAILFPDCCFSMLLLYVASLCCFGIGHLWQTFDRGVSRP